MSRPTVFQQRVIALVGTLTETGWAMETAYLFGVDGSLSMHGPGLSLQLPMDGCSANAQVGISHSI